MGAREMRSGEPMHKSVFRVMVSAGLVAAIASCGNAADGSGTTAPGSSKAEPRSDDSERRTSRASTPSVRLEPGATPPRGFDSAPAWSAKGEFIAASGQVVVIQTGTVENGNAQFKGVRASDGRQVWQIDGMQPPGATWITQPDESGEPVVESDTTQIGQSLVIRWTGTSKDDGLNTGEEQSKTALVAISTGKLLGRMHDTKIDSLGGGGPEGGKASGSAFSLESHGADGAGDGNAILFSDGRTGKLKNTLPKDAPDHGMSMTLPLAIGRQTAIWQNGETRVIQAMSDGKEVGPRFQCGYANPGTTGWPALIGDYPSSPSGNWFTHGAILISTEHPGTAKCFNRLSNADMTVEAVDDKGGLYATANDKLFYLAADAKKPAMEPQSAVAPAAVLGNGAVLEGEDGVQFVRRTS